MSPATIVLDELRGRDIHVLMEGEDQLRLRGPDAAITDDLLARVRKCKAEILEHLQCPTTCGNWDGPSYPSPGADLGPPTHFLHQMPVVCRVHECDQHEGGARWEILRCKQPDGDGVVGWAVITASCYVSIVRQRGAITTLTVPSRLTTGDLREARR